MRRLISLVLALWPGAASATADCRVLDYPDHYEVVCVGDTGPGSAAPRSIKQEPPPAVAGTPESAGTDVPPEQMTLNGLTRSFGAAWLKTRKEK